jgi:hypothetical protein
MSDNVLILHPRDALYRPEDPMQHIGWLEETGLVRDGVVSMGEHPAGERITFRTGPAFADLIDFGASSERKRAVLTDAARDRLSKLDSFGRLSGRRRRAARTRVVPREWLHERSEVPVLRGHRRLERDCQ